MEKGGKGFESSADAEFFRAMREVASQQGKIVSEGLVGLYETRKAIERHRDLSFAAQIAHAATKRSEFLTDRSSCQSAKYLLAPGQIPSPARHDDTMPPPSNHLRRSQTLSAQNQRPEKSSTPPKPHHSSQISNQSLKAAHGTDPSSQLERGAKETLGRTRVDNPSITKPAPSPAVSQPPNISDPADCGHSTTPSRITDLEQEKAIRELQRRASIKHHADSERNLCMGGRTKQMERLANS